MSDEKLIFMIRSCSTAGQYTQLSELILNGKGQALKNANSLDELMQSLEIQDHSAAILCLLLCKFNLQNINFDHLFAQIFEFVCDCNEEQIKAMPQYFSSLCHQLTEKLIETKQYLKGIDLLSKAIVKVQQSTSQLTSIHTDLCKLSLLAKCLKPALVFLDSDITDISKENDTYDVKYYLMYYYYGGMIYLTLNNYQRAFYFFQTAIATTGSAVSQIVIESYKKYILVSLLLEGKVQPLSKQTMAYLSRCVEPFCTAYTELADCYDDNSIDDLNAIVGKHCEIFTSDTNLGLVKQVVNSLVKVKMQKLTKTFMTLSLGDMASKVHLNTVLEAERKILQMIEDEEIFATINQQDGMVLFMDNPERYNTPLMYRKIEQELNKCIQLNEKLRLLDNEIALNPKYIQKIRNEIE